MPMTIKTLLISLDSTTCQRIQQRLAELNVDLLVAEHTEQALDCLSNQAWHLVIVAAGPNANAARSVLLELPVLPSIVFADSCSEFAGQCNLTSSYLRFFVSDLEKLVDLVDHFAQGLNGPVRMVAHDRRSRDLVELADRVATTQATVLLAGESGVGKEVFARHIHSRSNRATGPFVALNCAAIPETMLEAQLFGHEKGAYTGAHTSRPGKFELANGGTLLLDEISEMDLGLQAKLLRVLQENEVERIGAASAIPLNVRVLATTNRDLVGEVEAGRFRQDLFYRLSVFPIEIPPLRERPEDILPIAYRLLALQTTDQPRRRLTGDALDALTSYEWPGNIRELNNVIQRALILSTETVINGDTIRGAQHPCPGFGTEIITDRKLVPALRHAENEMIIEALAADNGNRRRAAEKLGISTRTLRYKLARMREAGIPVPG